MKKHTGMLRKCPFCGSDAVLMEFDEDVIVNNPIRSPEGTPVFHVECSGCHIRTREYSSGHTMYPERKHISVDDAKWQAVNAWNRRTTSAGEDATA